MNNFYRAINCMSLCNMLWPLRATLARRACSSIDRRGFARACHWARVSCSAMWRCCNCACAWCSLRGMCLALYVCLTGFYCAIGLAARAATATATCIHAACLSPARIDAAFSQSIVQQHGDAAALSPPPPAPPRPPPHAGHAACTSTGRIWRRGTTRCSAVIYSAQVLSPGAQTKKSHP